MSEAVLIGAWLRRWWWTPVVAVGLAVLVAFLGRPGDRIELTQEMAIYSGGHGWWHQVDLEQAHVHAILRDSLGLQTEPGRQVRGVHRFGGVEGVDEVTLRFQSWPRRAQVTVAGLDSASCQAVMARAIHRMRAGARSQLRRNAAEATSSVEAELRHYRKQLRSEERRLRNMSLQRAPGNWPEVLLAVVALRDARMRSAVWPGRPVEALRRDVKQGLQKAGLDATAVAAAVDDRRWSAAWETVARIRKLEASTHDAERRLDYCRSMGELDVDLIEPVGDPMVKITPPPPPWRRTASIALASMAAIFVLTMWFTSRRLLRAMAADGSVQTE